MKKINTIMLWIAIMVLAILGLNADTRSVKRDIYALDKIADLRKEINILKSAVDTNQKAIIKLLTPYIKYEKISNNLCRPALAL